MLKQNKNEKKGNYNNVAGNYCRSGNVNKIAENKEQLLKATI